MNQNIWTVSPYVYRATSSGLGVYDLSSEALINFITYAGGINSVWANDDYVYAATVDDGVYRCGVSGISTATTLSLYKNGSDITANETTYIHGNGDYLCVTTVSGVDRYKLSTGDREHSLIPRTGKCFQTSSGDYYYTVEPEVRVNVPYTVESWYYYKVVELSHPIVEDGTQFLIEIPTSGIYDIYSATRSDGQDIRFYDTEYNELNYWIEEWSYVSPPKVWVKLPLGCEKFFIFYGNYFANSQSSRENTFDLWDSFEGDTLDTNKWTFDIDGGIGFFMYYTMEGDSISFFSRTSGRYISLITKDTFMGGVVEYSIKKRGGSWYSYGLRWHAGFEDWDSTGVGNGVQVSLEEESLSAHYLQSDGGTASGIEYLPADEYTTHSFIEHPAYQASELDGEVISTSGVIDVSDRNLRFKYIGTLYGPQATLDWVRVRRYNPNPQTYTISDGIRFESPYDLIDNGELYAIYEGGGSHIYGYDTDKVIDSNYLSDIYVTEGTSIYDNANVIFLATSRGAYVIEEKRSDESNCRKRIYLTNT